MNSDALIARLMAQAEGRGVDLITLRALAEEASQAGASRALGALGLDDPRARRDMIQTGDQSFCIIGEWDDMDALAAGRPFMLATLDTFRDTLAEDTDPVSGPVVLELK